MANSAMQNYIIIFTIEGTDKMNSNNMILQQEGAVSHCRTPPDTGLQSEKSFIQPTMWPANISIISD